jgi:hypothetical protein
MGPPLWSGESRTRQRQTRPYKGSGQVLDNGRYVVDLEGENNLQVSVKPENMMHACFGCHNSDSGTTMQFCGKCKMGSYCDADCQRNDWHRHKGEECNTLKIGRDIVKDPIEHARATEDTLAASQMRQKFAG